jgi:hypothetical protein
MGRVRVTGMCRSTASRSLHIEQMAHRWLTTAFEKSDSLLQFVVSIDIDQIGGRQAMLSDKDWVGISLEFGRQFRGPSLQGGDEFCTHGVALQYHFARLNFGVLCVQLRFCARATLNQLVVGSSPTRLTIHRLLRLLRVPERSLLSPRMT